MNNFKIIVIKCVLTAVHKNCDDIWLKQIIFGLAPLNGMFYAHLCCYSRLYSEVFGRRVVSERRILPQFAFVCLAQAIGLQVDLLGPAWSSLPRGPIFFLVTKGSNKYI